MNYKKNILYFLFGIFGTIIILSGINFIVDPFQIYRKATFHKTIFMKSFYLNAGLIKNYNYDSVCIGSSMTQNFIINELKHNLGYRSPIKLPIAGGNIVEHYTVLSSAISTAKVRNVFFGLDILSLKNGNNRLPEYLYDDTLLNDYKYVFSIDTFKRSLIYPFLHLTINSKHPRLNYNLMFQWQHNYNENDFDADKVIKKFHNNSINLDNDVNQNMIVKERINNFNMYIVPTIKNNPDIKFTLFYPPYSILLYKSMSSLTLDSFINTKIKINQILKKYPNVKIFDFQIAKEITHNLDNYKDLTHYHQKINTWVLKQIHNNNYLVKKDNIDRYLDDWKEQIKNYTFNKT